MAYRGGRWFRLVWASGLGALACAAVAGCGDDKKFLKTYPAGGTAVFRGQPMEFAQITLFPVSKETQFRGILPRGDVGPDGSYQLWTYRYGDGVPEGEYKLTIAWPSGPESQAGVRGYVADRLRGKYTNPEGSSIRVTISPGENTLPPVELR